MPKPQSKRAIAAMTGHEPGSIYASLSHADQARFRRWLQQVRTDNYVLEAQLEDRPFIRPRSLQEV